MKFLLTTLLMAPTAVSAFTILPPPLSVSSTTTTTTTTTSTTTCRFLENRINEKIDLDSPKVATMETLEGKTKKVYCRCWQSGTFPLCDGRHMKHNEATGDNVGPLIVTVKESSGGGE